MKTCIVCIKQYPLNDFHKKSKSPDGLQNICKKCACERSREYYKNNRAKHRRSCERWKKNNPEGFKHSLTKTNELKREFNKERRGQDFMTVGVKRRVKYLTCVTDDDKPTSCQVCCRFTSILEPHFPDKNNSKVVIWACERCFDVILKCTAKRMALEKIGGRS